jgi:uncharacterized membrane protein YfcA
LVAWTFIPPEIVNLPLFLSLGTLSAMLFAASKAGFGGSIGLLAVPVMVEACGGRTNLALGILLPLLIAADYVAGIVWWRRWKLRPVLLLLPGTVVGIAAAWAIIAAMQSSGHFAGEQQKKVADAWMMLAVATVAMGFVILQIVLSLRSRPLTFRPNPAQGSATGFLAGVVSTMAHAANPVVAMYMIPQQMPKEQFVATTALYYWFLNQAKLAPYIAMGMIDLGTLASCAIFLPGILLGAIGGVYLHHRLGEKTFNTAVYVLLALAGADLLRKAIPVLLS